jgi:hypothetical protein
VVPHEPPDEVFSPRFGVEVDAMPGGTYVCSGSMKRAMDSVVGDAVAGRKPLREIFSGRASPPDYAARFIWLLASFDAYDSLATGA